MANITQTIAPAKITYSGNPVLVAGNIDELEDVKEVFLDLKDSEGKTVQMRFVNPYFPDPDTPVRFEFEFRGILDTLLKFDPTTAHLLESRTHFQPYDYRLYTNREVEAGNSGSVPYTTKYILQGYLPAKEVQTRLASVLSAPLTLLTNQPPKPVRFDHAEMQNEFLYLLLASDVAYTGVEMVVDLVSTTGATSTKIDPLPAFSNYRITCVRAHEALEQLLGVDTPNYLKYKVYFRLKNGATTLYETYSTTYLRDDNLNELHHTKRLIFQNSRGGLDTVNLIGESEHTLTIGRKTSNDGSITDYNYITDSRLPRANPYASISTSEKVKAYLGTGHSKEYLNYLCELFTSPQVWELENHTNRLLPVRMTTGTYQSETDALGVRKVKVEYIYDFPTFTF